MTATDYDALSKTYDADPVRTNVPRDPVLAELVAERVDAGATLAVLDVGCGTGTYLATQAAALADANVTFAGIDPSEGMLDRARTKTAAELTRGTAESLPYEDDAFDYVVTRFAFHHFEDKAKALDELFRVLRPGGRLRIENLCPEHMAGWWVYRAFPGCLGIDAGRFWGVPRLVTALEERGAAPAARVATTVTRRRWAERLEVARRRDVSELVLLPDPAFDAGIARLADAVARDPEATFLDEVAVLDLAAPAAGNR